MLMVSKQPEAISASIAPELTVVKFIFEQKSSISVYLSFDILISSIWYAALSPTPLIAPSP